MLKVSLDIEDRLTNGQTGNISHIEFAQDSAQKVYVKFSDEHTGLKAMRSSYLDDKMLGFLLKNVDLRFR